MKTEIKALIVRLVILRNDIQKIANALETEGNSAIVDELNDCDVYLGCALDVFSKEIQIEQKAEQYEQGNSNSRKSN